MQRARGSATLTLKNVGNRTRIDHLHQSGNAKIRVPRTTGPALEAVLINTAGGITGGDELKWNIEAGSSTTAIVTTQACERIYRSTGDTGRQETALTVSPGGHLFWLPQETILFDGSKLWRGLDVALAEDARFLGLETIVLGRAAMGEHVENAFFHDRWRIRRDSELVHADDLHFDIGGTAATANPFVLADNRVFATLVSITPDDAEARNLLLAGVRARLGKSAGGASLMEGRMVVRATAPSSYDMRTLLLPVLELFLAGHDLPKVWRV